ncbi:glycosyltransferase family 4 protein [Clostridium saccharobutylicum]|uniref:Putative glucosyltransferase YtcC n=1 Tax=Clostridium saccharobutylicum DSM 13864 TaxID=1345695 RepID=U5MWI5_CLOSA|nr:glycosyltransferase family 4 protein [Clostridium saccharobutylicum]AGX43827.1 putative glucosyltransferase YtcC [Clostridium saccharobutylicum DSM 13864]AQR91127.1 spore coat protein SA [Clostridium saccharobutylicum]AQS01031.1 spore coat protein SA [Clostridium saccharobutylicum]AQS10770.1 spore coat protein SA [Clostridium saccharobutylicum]AQS15014.1 spore coat protein SA [Clostridium saccharobutylicum]
MIKILYLHAGAEMYGADKVLLELIKGLDKTRFNPIVVLPCEGILVNALRKEGIETEVIPYPILRRKYFNLKGIIKYIISYRKYCKLILKLVKDKNINLLHINTTAVLEGIYLRKKLKIPMIWHVHEILINPKIIYKFISFIIGKYSDRTVVVSNAVGNHLINSNRVNPNKVKTIYNGVNNAIFNSNNETEYLREELQIPKDAFIVGMIGRVNAWKGQKDFLAAIEPILAKYHNVYAVMVGGVFEGEEWRMEELKQKVSESHFKDRIIIQNFRKDCPNLHNIFDIFVLPSTNPDPLPTVVLEAMATGKPVIGYKHGGICEMVVDEETGLLAEVRNTEDMSSKIELLIKDRIKMIDMGIQAKKRQKMMFSLKSYIESFSKLYSNLVSDGIRHVREN